MNIPSLAVSALSACALAACAQTQPAENVPAPSPAVKVTGAAQSCIPLQPLSSTAVRDDRTIDFIVSGKRGYRNTLTGSCPGLKAANAFTYETSLSQLCNTDIIYTLQNYGGTPQRGAACGLGQFVPVEFQR
ncbi:MAG: hypothetical protein M0R03_18305 [Novosphingobium sp.]|nr:hypothetical protein [Novosphingobium sp.]